MKLIFLPGFWVFAEGASLRDFDLCGPNFYRGLYQVMGFKPLLVGFILGIVLLTHNSRIVVHNTHHPSSFDQNFSQGLKGLVPSLLNELFLFHHLVIPHLHQLNLSILSLVQIK